MVGQLTDLIASIPPGTVTVAVRTPLGVMVTDPFAPGASSVGDTLRMLGVSVDVYPGPPRPEDLAAPSLASNLTVLGLVGAGLLAWTFLKRR